MARFILIHFVIALITPAQAEFFDRTDIAYGSRGPSDWQAYKAEHARQVAEKVKEWQAYKAEYKRQAEANVRRYQAEMGIKSGGEYVSQERRNTVRRHGGSGRRSSSSSRSIPSQDFSSNSTARGTGPNGIVSFSSEDEAGYYDKKGRLIMTKTRLSRKGNAYIGVYLKFPAKIYIDDKRITPPHRGGDVYYKGGYHYIIDNTPKKREPAQHKIRLEAIHSDGSVSVQRGSFRVKYGETYKIDSRRLEKALEYEYWVLLREEKKSLADKQKWHDDFLKKTEDTIAQLRRNRRDVERRVDDLDDADLKDKLQAKVNAFISSEHLFRKAKRRLADELERRNEEAYEWFGDAISIYQKRGREPSYKYIERMQKEVLPGQLRAREIFDRDYNAHLAQLLNDGFTVAALEKEVASHRQAIVRRNKIRDYEDVLANWNADNERHRKKWKNELLAKYVSNPEKAALARIEERREKAKDFGATATLLQEIFAAEERSLRTQLVARRKAIDLEEDQRRTFSKTLEGAYRKWFAESLSIEYGNNKDNEMWDKEEARRESIANTWKKTFPTTLTLSKHSVKQLSDEGQQYFDWLAKKKDTYSDWQQNRIEDSVTSPLTRLKSWYSEQQEELSSIRHKVVRTTIAARVEKEHQKRFSAVSKVEALLKKYRENWDGTQLTRTVTDQLLNTGKVDLSYAQSQVAPILKGRARLGDQIDNLEAAESARQKLFASVSDMATKETARYPIAHKLPKDCGKYTYILKLDGFYSLNYDGKPIAFVDPKFLHSAACHNDTLGILTSLILIPGEEVEGGFMHWFQFDKGVLVFSHVAKDEIITRLWWDDMDKAFIVAANIKGHAFSLLLEEGGRSFDEVAERTPPAEEKGLFKEIKK